MPEYKVVVLGGGSVGKSCITMQFINYHFIYEYDPTIEDSYRKQVNIDDEVAVLDILDTAGQEEYSAMRDQYMRLGQGFLLVYSITDRSSFDEMVVFHEKIYKAQDKDVGTEKLPITLIGNKSDLESERQVATIEGQDLANRWKAPFLEVSAKNRTNIDEAFFEVVREIRTSRGLVQPTKKKAKKGKFMKGEKCLIV